MTRRTHAKKLALGGKAGAAALTAGLLSAGLVGAPTASASAPAASEAAPAKSAVCAGNTDFGMGCFEPWGDHIVVADHETDGWRIEVRWETDYGRSGVCAIQAGKDYRDCNYNMAENREIYFEVHAINEKFGLREVLDGAYALI